MLDCFFEKWRAVYALLPILCLLLLFLAELVESTRAESGNLPEKSMRADRGSGASINR